MTAKQQGIAWYRQAIVKPSRYLISSGDMEPVLESGVKHSIFAERLLGFLQHTDQSIFSASDLGQAIRDEVSQLTGQMVRMGPLALGGHSGGEFIFVKDRARMMAAAPPQQTLEYARASNGGVTRSAETDIATEDVLRDALAVVRQGATNAAQRLLAVAQRQSPNDAAVRAVVAYLDQDRKTKEQADLSRLIEVLEEQGAADNPEKAAYKDYARPRIIACLGPQVQAGTVDESAALLYRICLRAELEKYDRVQLVEREALQELLMEMQLGTSDLSDPRAQSTIGKLLPAGLLLMGDILPTQAGGEVVYLRLIDTETTRTLGSFSQKRQANEEIFEVCANLAGPIIEKAVRARPLTARVLEASDTLLKAGVGRFHGLQADARFDVLERIPGDKDTPGDYQEHLIGSAQLETVGEIASEFVPTWSEPISDEYRQRLWLREINEPPAGETPT